MSRSGFPLRHILSDHDIDILRDVFRIPTFPPDDEPPSYAFIPFKIETYQSGSSHPKNWEKTFHAAQKNSTKRRWRAKHEPSIYVDPNTTPEVLADADIAPATVRYLKLAGVNIQDVRKIGLRTASDEVIFAFAQQKKALLITHDHDHIRHDDRFDLTKTAGVVILPRQPRWRHEPHTPAAYPPLRRALHQLLRNLPAMANERFGTVYEYMRTRHYQVYSASSGKDFFGQRIPDRTLPYDLG